MSELPFGWEYRRVDEVGNVQLGRQRSPALATGPYMKPYLRVANVLDGYIDYSDILEMNFTPQESTIYGLLPGDILLNEGQELNLVGRCAIFDGPPGMCFQNTLLRFRSRTVLPRFAEAVFKYWLDHGKFRKISKQTTSIAHLGIGPFAAMPFPVAPIREQQRITEILDALDEQIRQHTASLHKWIKLRSGFLNDFTRKTWGQGSRRTLAQVSTNKGDYGSNSAAIPHDPHFPRYVRITDITDDGVLRADSLASLSPRGAKPYLLQDGDLVIARTGFTTGKSYLYRPSDGICAFAGYLIRFNLNPATALPEYVFFWTQSSLFSGWINRTIREVGQRNISAREYAQYQLAIPSFEAQRALVTRMQAIDEVAQKERTITVKLRMVKQGLMEDLLSGRVRVPDL